MLSNDREALRPSSMSCSGLSSGRPRRSRRSESTWADKSRGSSHEPRRLSAPTDIRSGTHRRDVLAGHHGCCRVHRGIRRRPGSPETDLMPCQTPEGHESSYAVVGALTPKVDFVNLFLLVLRFTGNRRDY